MLCMSYQRHPAPRSKSGLCRFFGLKNVEVCVAAPFPHANLADPPETWHSENTFSALGLNAATLWW